MPVAPSAHCARPVCTSLTCATWPHAFAALRQVNPLATLLMMASVAMVIVYLYGELWIIGLRFNECAPPGGTLAAKTVVAIYTGRQMS